MSPIECKGSGVAQVAEHGGAAMASLEQASDILNEHKAYYRGECVIRAELRGLTLLTAPHHSFKFTRAAFHIDGVLSMTFAKLSTAVATIALGATVMFGSANAAPIPINPGGSYIIAGGNDYSYTSPTLIGNTSGNDVFNFTYLGGVTSASNDTSINPKFSVHANSYTNIVVSWLIGNTTLASHTFTNGEFGTTLPIALPSLTTNAATLYHLVITWTKPALSTGVYDTVISTAPPGVSFPTPLPPAALLFASVLAGLGLVQRRRMAKR